VAGLGRFSPTQPYRNATIIVMAQVNKSQQTPSRQEIASAGRALVRRAFKGAIATIDAKSGYPYASLVTVATDAPGAPTLLISNLARHTANLAKDPRASIMVDETGALADPLQGARVTLYGKVERTKDEAVRRRFLARHPEAAFYADFPDFGFFRLAVEGAHYIGGFGRIFDLTPAELLVPTEGVERLLEDELGIVEHMNRDHADAIELYATALADGEPGPWRMTGIDPEGFDIMCDGRARRVLFAESITTPADARKELVRLATEARAGRQ
jgi:heme oxygenase (biliverdin-IX-beta and delta-forming)